MEKIIIAIDPAEFASLVIHEGFLLARKLEASIDLVSIIDQELDTFIASTGLMYDNQWEERLASATQELTKIKNENSDLKIEVITSIAYPKEFLLNHIFESKATYIIIGTHGRSGLAQLFIGGTAEHIVRHSIIPVVVVPFKTSEH
jgi:nucleotide-binding universal stress UspA family protein